MSVWKNKKDKSNTIIETKELDERESREVFQRS